LYWINSSLKHSQNFDEASMPRIITRKPIKELAGLVSQAGWAQQSMPDMARLYYRQLPNANARIFYISLPMPLLPGVLGVVGPHQNLVNANPLWRQMAWLTLKPGALGALLGRPAHMLRNKVERLETYWGKLATRPMHQSMAKAKDGASQLKVLEQFVLNQLGPKTRAEPTVFSGMAYIEALHGQAQVTQVAQKLGCPLSTLVRLFRQHLGLSPKQASQLFRVRALLEGFLPGQAPHLARWALEHGYCDQSHANRDFKELMGMTPIQFQAERDSKGFQFSSPIDVIVRPRNLFNPIAAPDVLQRLRKLMQS
jgi:AraC-like DNA-binding protein